MNLDPSLFQGTAQYYSKYRNGYDDCLYEEIVRKARLGKESVILDVGTGTGTIAHSLAPVVKEVYALDPSREMLEEVERIAKEQSISNITCIEDVAEHIDQYEQLQNLDLITFGASLHWVQDIDAMFQKVANALNTGGWVCVVSVTSTHLWTEDPSDGWRFWVTNIIKKYLGDDRKAGNSSFENKTIRKSMKYEDVLCGRSDIFTNFCSIEVDHCVTWTPEKVLGFLYSTSFARKDYFGEQVSSFEDEVRALFNALNLTEWQETERQVALMAQRR